MEIPAAGLDTQASYRLLAATVVPRPVAWVTTASPAGLVNVAAFACFTFVSHQPPMIALSIAKRGSELKDTARNAQQTREFVVHIGDETMIEQIHACGFEYAPDESEAEAVGLDLAPSRLVTPPRLALAPIALECRLDSVVAFGNGGCQLHIGEVVMFHIRDDLYQDGRVDMAALRPVARLAGWTYAKLGEFVDMPPLDIKLPKR